uniref:Epstein-Barr virus early gene encoding a component of the restricted early antigen complex n=1 Tax=Epstein-Barr virus (strain GD1) TaxID=10376 RepID=Q9YPG0_EBVG|nr:ORF1 [human gammaherpesvirus 4]
MSRCVVFPPTPVLAVANATLIELCFRSVSCFAVGYFFPQCLPAYFPSFHVLGPVDT